MARAADALISNFSTGRFKIFGLGDVNFPEKAFADQNFHCGFYSDGDDLEDILKFREDSLESYFKNEESKVSGIQKAVTKCVKGIVKTDLFSNPSLSKQFGIMIRSY